MALKLGPGSEVEEQIKDAVSADQEDAVAAEADQEKVDFSRFMTKEEKAAEPKPQKVLKKEWGLGETIKQIAAKEAEIVAAEKIAYPDGYSYMRGGLQAFWLASSTPEEQHVQQLRGELVELEKRKARLSAAPIPKFKEKEKDPAKKLEDLQKQFDEIGLKLPDHQSAAHVQRPELLAAKKVVDDRVKGEIRRRGAQGEDVGLDEQHIQQAVDKWKKPKVKAHG